MKHSPKSKEKREVLQLSHTNCATQHHSCDIPSLDYLLMRNYCEVEKTYAEK